MELLVRGSSADYLAADDVVDHTSPEVSALAASLRASASDDIAFARAAFEHVRDSVAHSWDAQDPRVTLSASSVLREGVGLCYAKSHLLAALLRSQGVPTGLCYQLLTDDGSTYMLHGLVAVFLDGDWHRQDPRGNKDGVDAQFSLGSEQLAWPVRPGLGELDLPEVYAAPSPRVVATLRAATDILALCDGGLPTEV
ncbi:transglutaminase-like domain-containing protein [Nocardioides montaniterrae]